MLEGMDFIDIALVVIIVLCLVGLLFVHPVPETAAYLKEVIGACFVGLGFKKVPQTVRI